MAGKLVVQFWHIHEYHAQASIMYVCYLPRLVHAEVIFRVGSTTQHQPGVKVLFMVDAKGIQTDLRLERSVRVPVYVVSCTEWLFKINMCEQNGIRNNPICMYLLLYCNQLIKSVDCDPKLIHWVIVEYE